ncbi:MAG TPA: N-acetylglucosamine-6-phosphate deacetylase [Candidatus Acidoferrales bacterium]|nr:N-acetylglucosamine-6-phosphate deacetylase [Candidatus Acidoferrales bacterium]
MTAQIAITAAELCSADQRIANPVVLIEDGHIVDMASRSGREIPAKARVFDFPDAVLVPGYVDLHIHGAAGYDVMEGSDDGLNRMSAFLAQRGVTSFLATTVTAQLSRLEAAVEKIALQIEHWPANSPLARPIGIHLEGPCISDARRGVHPREYVCNPTVELLERMHQAAHGKLKLITIAPELAGALEVIRAAVARGIKVSIGHTDGTAEDALAAIEAGATHVTHTFNAMRPLEHRAPGVLGVALSDDRLCAEIIADGVHVDPRVVEIFLRSKGPERAVLVTDAISATGMPDGRYRLGEFEVTVAGPRAECDGRLAGSVLTLERAVQNVMQFANWPLPHAVRLATANPARVLGCEKLGRLETGARADIAVLSREGVVQQSFVGGIAARN